MKRKLTLLLVVVSLTATYAQRRSSGSSKVTSSKVATEASKSLRDPKSSKTEKSLAGSALSQSKGKKN